MLLGYYEWFYLYFPSISDYRQLEIHLKCNWNEEFYNPQYIKPRLQGDRYQFIVESSYGCIKWPMQLLVSED